MIRAILENFQPLAIAAAGSLMLLYLGSAWAAPYVLRFFGLPVP